MGCLFIISTTGDRYMVGRIRDKDRKIVPSTGRKRSEEEIKDSRKEGADFIRERETLLKQGVEKTEAAKQAAGVLSQGPTAAQQIAALQAQAPPPVAPEAIPAEAPEAEGASGGPPQATPSLAGIFTGSNFQERAAEAGGQGIASPVPLGGISGFCS